MARGTTTAAGRGGRRSPTRPALGDRLPPQNLEAERSVLGSVLLDNDVLHEIVPMLAVADFYRDVHQTIYQAIRDLYDLGKGIDAVTLADELIAPRPVREDRRRRDADRDRQQRPARGQRQVLCRDRPREGDRPPVDRQRHRDHPGRVFQSIHGAGAAGVGRAEGLRHRRGADPGRHARAEGRDHAGDGSDRQAGRDAAATRSPGSRPG